MVLRMWPTCIGLATFGLEKSTMIFSPGSRLGHAEHAIAAQRAHPLRQEGGEEAKIDEARAGDLRRLAQADHIEARDDLLGDLPGIGAPLLRQQHGDIRLVIAEAGIRGGGHKGLGGAIQRGAQPGGQKGGDGLQGL